jgi:hypothetical protein
VIVMKRSPIAVPPFASLAVALVLAAGCAGAPPGTAPGTAGHAAAAVPPASPAAAAPAPATVTTPATVPATSTTPVPAFGIEFLDTRLSAAGSVVDLRYRVLDADKAAPLLDRKLRPVLVNAATGQRYYVPQPPIVGSLRQTVRNQAVQVGRTYFMLFANPDRVLKSGDTLALWVGEQRVGEFRLP